MSTTNDAILYAISTVFRFGHIDEVVTGSASQAGAAPLLSAISRVKKSVANGGLVLKSVGTQDAPPIAIVINDSPNTVNVYCASGEHCNGTSNSSLAVASGATGVFFPVPNAKGGTIDWRGAVIS